MEQLKLSLAVLLEAGILWASAVFFQRAENEARSTDFHIPAIGRWSRLLGVKPGQKCYLRPTSLQIIAFAYLVTGWTAVWLFEVTVLKPIRHYILGGGLLGLGLIWIVLDIVAKRQTNQ